MKRSIKSLVIAVIAMAFFIGAYYLMINWQPEDKTNGEQGLTSAETIYIVDEDTDNIDYVEFNNGAENYTIKNGESPSIDGFFSHIIDSAKLKSALSSCASVYAGKKLENVQNFADYGLEKADKYVLIKTKDGKEHKIILGNNTNFENEYYVKTKDSNTVYTISSYTFDSLMKSPEEYRNLDICVLDNTSMEALSIDKQGKSELSIVLDKDFTPLNEYQTTSYIMTYPYKNVTASQDKLNELLENISSLTASSVAEENPTNLYKYGLDKPYVINYTDAKGKNTIKMGNYAENGNVYIMYNNLPVVYLADCPFYETVKQADADEFVERFVSLFNIMDIESVKLSADGKEHTMSIKKKGEDKYEYSINGKIKTEDNFKKIYQQIIGVTSVEFTSEVPSGSEKCKVTFSFLNGTNKTFIYYQYNDRYSIVKADNGMVCLVLTKNIDKIFESLENI